MLCLGAVSSPGSLRQHIVVHCIRLRPVAHREARLRQRDGHLIAAERHALYELALLDAAAGGGHGEGQVRRHGRHPERVEVERLLRAVRATHVRF